MRNMNPAILSKDRLYRYRLCRPVGLGEGTCLFVMLNPSTADEVDNDPTIRRCLGFARRWGYAYLMVVNLFAHRSPTPESLVDMTKHGLDPIGTENIDWIAGEAQQADIVVCAWGSMGSHIGQGHKVRQMFRDMGIRAKCFGLTSNNQPRHPLYQRADAELMELV